MSLFDGFLKEQNQKQREEAAKKAAEVAAKAKEKAGITTTNNTTKTVTKITTTVKEVPAGITVRFAGETVMVTEKTMKLDDIRKALEKGDGEVSYPELTKELTRMEYIEKKKLVVVMPKGNKGGQLIVGHFNSVAELEKNYKPVNVLTLDDGTKFEVRINNIGIFSVLIQEGTDSSKQQQFFEGFEFKLPRIPFEFFAQIAAWFKNYETEALVYVFYNKPSQKYFLHVPQQDVSAIHYSSDEDEEFIDLQQDEDNVLVMDIHSHGYMIAKFSEVDDMYHKGNRLYAVVGKLHHNIPDVTVRFCCGGKYREIPFKKVFENPFEVKYPAGWDKKLNICKI